MKNILLATDLGVSCDRALERALKIAKERNAKLHIVHALPGYKAKNLRASLKQETEDTIRGYLNDYKDTGNVEVTIDAAQDGPTDTHILHAAHKIKADLIVMGVHSKTKMRDMFVGTTIERVARKSTKPLLMVVKKPAGSYQSVIAGIDYAPASRAALRTAMYLVPKAAFEIVHTYQIPVAYPTTAEYALETYAQTEKVQNKAIQAFTNTETEYFKKTFKKPNKKLSYKLAEGRAYETLVKEAKAWKADLITIGAHSAPIITPSKLGGVAEDILANPPCDVLLVRE